MSEASLTEALAEIERVQRNTQRLLEAGKLTPHVFARKEAALARAHKCITFLAANETWIVPVYQTRMRMQREAEALCVADPLLRETLEALDAEIVAVQPMFQLSATQESAA